ncbi:hypothetical protein [uncultured Megasphaera sp.]|jgi:outer membrane biosynthesis protein TonB|uniref:hypothetical protein n=1 Tax=uncultured Megasphaera sp. TaxID=165188 RepID=UPI00206D7DF0|nr:hypothetical protein [uncultured Megasphaera sp.]DAE81220.1 MAG TPA: hypothetical protein [Caudoviricetes sp.]
MKITIELNTEDIAKANQSHITTLTEALQYLALEQTPEQPSVDVPVIPERAPEDQKGTAAPVEEEPVKPARSKRPAKKAEPVKPKAAGPSETPDVPEPAEPVEAPKPAEPTEVPETPKPAPEVDRDRIRNRLKELSRAGKAKGIKALILKQGAQKLSELSDAALADVLKEAESL